MKSLPRFLQFKHLPFLPRLTITFVRMPSAVAETFTVVFFALFISLHMFHLRARDWLDTWVLSQGLQRSTLLSVQQLSSLEDSK